MIYSLAALAHFVLALRWSGRVGSSRQLAVGLTVCFLLGMGLGARILHDLLHGQFNPANYLRPGYFFSDGLWGGPLAYLGLAVAMVVVLPLIVAPLLRIQNLTNWRAAALDLMVLALPIPMAIAKVACMVNGCCFGSPCNWPWGIVFPYRATPPAGIPRHPTQLYEAGALVFIYLVLVTLERRRWHGLLTLWFVFLYGLARPVTEFFRLPTDRPAFLGALTLSQTICLAGSVISLAGLWVIRPPRRAFEPPMVRTAYA